MAVQLDWGKINTPAPSNNNQKNNQSNNQNSNFKPLKFLTLGRRNIGKTFYVRPVGKAVGFYKATVKGADGKPKNIYVDVDDQGGDGNVKKHPLYKSHGVKFSIRYAINVIDRSDNQLKILEGGPSIFGELQSYWKMTDKEPGGPHGADFSIEVTGKKGKDYYLVNKQERTPFTKDEVEYIKKEKLFKVDQVFKETPAEKWKSWVGEVSNEEDLNMDFSQKNKYSNNTNNSAQNNVNNNFDDNNDNSDEFGNGQENNNTVEEQDFLNDDSNDDSDNDTDIDLEEVSNENDDFMKW